MIVAFAGGGGGARLARGLAAVLSPSRLAFVVNTGDDFEHLGLTICPDLDTVMYTLGGVANPATGWGRSQESWNLMQTLATLGGETWFRLGDRDLATHLLRTHALNTGAALSEITRALARRLGVVHRLFPMSETPVGTRVLTARGELAFQDYFVRLRCKPRVSGFRYAGSRRARVPDQLRTIMDSGKVRAVIFCPSNPYVSIAPILSVPALREWLRQRAFPVIAVSPIVGGAAIKGPAAKMMRELGAHVSVRDVVDYYGDTVDGWVIDRADARFGPQVQAMGKAVLVTDTIMSSLAKSVRLAKDAAKFAQTLSARA